MSLQQAEQFEDNEQYNEAYEEYKKLYEKNPKDLTLLERLGHLAVMLNDENSAEEYYTKILEFDATNTLAYEQLMDIYANTNRYKYYIYRANLRQTEQKYEQAINDYKKAISCTQEQKEIDTARFVIAVLYEQTGQNLKAVDEYLKLADSEDASKEVYLRLANLYMKEDAKSAAADILEQAIKNGHQSADIKEALAQIYIKDGNPQKALEITENELTKIKCLLGCERNSEAFTLLNENEQKYKNEPQYYALKAEYYYVTKDYDKALECVNKYDEFVKNSVLTYQMRALIYENKNDEYNAHLNWGKYNLARGDKDIAINEYLNAFQLKNDDINLLNSLAALLEETGDVNHAVEFYERISKIDKTDRNALEKLADFRESIGDYGVQSDYLEKLYELNPRNSSVALKLAQTYEKLRNKPDAIKYYNVYLEIGKGTPDYAKVKSKLEKLNNTEMKEDEGLIGVIMKLFGK